MFLGLTAVTLTLLRGEGVVWFWGNDARLALLAGANLWSLWLAVRIVRHWQASLLALLPFAAVLAWVDSAWGWMFWWW